MLSVYQHVRISPKRVTARFRLRASSNYIFLNTPSCKVFCIKSRNAEISTYLNASVQRTSCQYKSGSSVKPIFWGPSHKTYYTFLEQLYTHTKYGKISICHKTWSELENTTPQSVIWIYLKSQRNSSKLPVQQSIHIYCITVQGPNFQIVI